jgi:arylsulfatase A-like enzyme
MSRSRQAILLLLDSLPLRLLGCYGGFQEATPGFDRLAATGTVFEAAITTCITDGSAFGPETAWHRAWDAAVADARQQGIAVSEEVCSTLHELTEAATSSAIATRLQSSTPGLLAILGVDLVPPPVHGHLSVVDEAVRAIHSAVIAANECDALLIVAALTGETPTAEFPRLRSGTVNVPVLLWTADLAAPGLRCHQLVESTDILPTVYGWLQPDREETGAVDLMKLSRSEADVGREEIRVEGLGERAVRTATRYIVVQTAGAERIDGSSNRSALFFKPHDAWDQLDVGGTMPDERDELVKRTLRSGQSLRD